jgi:uncharacterized RDD family membrane protein YckC
MIDEQTSKPRRHIVSGTRCGARYFAALADNVLAIIFAVVAAQMLPIDHELTRGLSAYVFYLTYYAVSEGFFAATPAKWYFGLRVVDENGLPCTMRSAVIRTSGRVLDANPLFLGALPAAVLVWFTEGRQHLGDLFAGTYVVRVEDVVAS